MLLQPLNLTPTPDSAREIQNRILDITFQSGFLREMQMFTRLKAHRPLFVWSKLDRHIARTHFHLIAAEMGRKAGKKWLADHYVELGRSSSVDLSAVFA